MFMGRKRFLTLLVAVGMMCTNMSTYANEIGPGYQTYESQERILKSDADITRVEEDGIYTYGGKQYYIKDNQIVTEDYIGDTWYTRYGVAASDDVYEFTGGVEEKDKAYWVALKELSESTPNENEYTIIKSGFPTGYEAIAYTNRVESIYNVTEIHMHFAFRQLPPDPYYFLIIVHTEKNISAAKGILEGMKLVDQTYENLGFDNIEGEEARIKAIHDWLVYNIRYDQSLEKRKGVSALKEGKTVCAGYTQLFYLWAKKAGIDVEVIDGVSPNNNGSFSMNENGHIWNRVKLNGEYKYIDVTWNANVIDSLYEAKAIRSFTEEEEQNVKDKLLYRYYLKDREEFNKEHFGFIAHK